MATLLGSTRAGFLKIIERDLGLVVRALPVASFVRPLADNATMVRVASREGFERQRDHDGTSVVDGTVDPSSTHAGPFKRGATSVRAQRHVDMPAADLPAPASASASVHLGIVGVSSISPLPYESGTVFPSGPVPLTSEAERGVNLSSPHVSCLQVVSRTSQPSSRAALRHFAGL